MAKPAKQKRKRKRYSLPEAGSSPGVVYIDKNALEPVIMFHSYNDHHYAVKQLDNIENLSRILSNHEFNYWIEIKGFGSLAMFETLSNDFG
jgi:magnesium transporter